MECLKCQYPLSHVVSTDNQDLKKRIVRRRECMKCGQRFTTHETLRPSNYKTVPPTHVLPK